MPNSRIAVSPTDSAQHTKDIRQSHAKTAQHHDPSKLFNPPMASGRRSRCRESRFKQTRLHRPSLKDEAAGWPVAGCSQMGTHVPSRCVDHRSLCTSYSVPPRYTRPLGPLHVWSVPRPAIKQAATQPSWSMDHPLSPYVGPTSRDGAWLVVLDNASRRHTMELLRQAWADRGREASRRKLMNGLLQARDRP